MSAAEQYPALAKMTAYGWVAARPLEAQGALSEIDSLRAELSALKARRCDGCAHYVDISTPAKRYGMCRSAENEDAPACVDADRPFALLVDADHYCAAFVAP